MTTMIDNSQKRKLVLFSGGFDSTLVLAKLVSEAKDHETICAVSINHSLTGVQKLRREYESQLLILRALRKKYPKIHVEHEVVNITSNWICGDTTNSRGLAQPILWLCNILPLLKDGDQIYVGYNLSDQANLHTDNINNLIYAACSIQEGKKVELLYPLKYYDKTEIIKSLIIDFDYLLDLCVSCESLVYEGEKVCGDCTPCTHLKQALMHLSLDARQYADVANRMLKELFGLNLSVTYDSQLDFMKDLDNAESIEVKDDYKIDCE